MKKAIERIKMQEFFKITKPSYKYYKLTPNNSVRNQSTYKIARTVASLYRNVFQRIKVEESKVLSVFNKEFLVGTKYNLNVYEKISYYVYIEKKKINFYFIIPEQHSSVMEERMSDVWSGITIDEVDEIPKFKDSATKYALQYEKEDALSLAVDRRNNDLLRSNINVVNVLEENDKVGILYNFIPMNQHGWKYKYKNTINKVKSNLPVEKDKGSIAYISKYLLKHVTDLVDLVLDVFTFGDKKSESGGLESLLERILKNDKMSKATIEKENAVILETQIIVFSEAEEKARELNNARSVVQSFETISENNRLVSRRIKTKINFNSYRVNKAPTMKVSDTECQNFISLAGRDILEEHNFIDKIETKETKVPEELQEGEISIGISTHRGHKQEAFLTDDKEYKNLALMLIGPTRAGKSTLIGNISNDALNNGECVVMFDFIKNCELSQEVSELFPGDKVLNIECDDFEKLQGLGYNEVGYETDTFKRYDNAKRQTTQLMSLIDCVNGSGASPLTPRMRRYFASASLVSFINNGSIKDVFDILQDHNKRHRFINEVPNDQFENMEEYINSLHSLDERDKEGEIIGTRDSLISGVIDRLDALKQNTYIELMLKKDTKENIDLTKEIQKNQIICIKMPESMFSTDEERDVYSTYWITKIWLALQMRAKDIPDRSKHTKVNLVIDEIYQVENTEKFLTDKLSRLAKFSVKPIISCHYIGQLDYLRPELRSANASYMLISGCDKDNYNEFRDELKPYEMEDLLNLKRWHSLNIIKHQNGYGKFITALPGPVGSKKEVKDAEIIENNCLQPT
jgi:hypothetical protein